jgi:2-haloacid dehalogenase
MSRVVLFDVNETLLDLGALDDVFENAFGEAFGNASAREAWFQTVLHTALRITATGGYAPFSAVGAAALDALAERRVRDLSAQQRGAILDTVNRLPPHPDARPGLERLRGAGFRLAALSNSGLEDTRAKLEHAELDRFLDAIFSADEVERFKPAPEPYRMAAQRLGVEPGDVCFVAAHDWDVDGARRVGFTTAFVQREGQRLGPLVKEPSLVAPDLESVAEQIIEAAEERT